MSVTLAVRSSKKFNPDETAHASPAAAMVADMQRIIGQARTLTGSGQNQQGHGAPAPPCRSSTSRTAGLPPSFAGGFAPAVSKASTVSA